MYLRIALVRSIVLSEVAEPGTTSTRGVSSGALPHLVTTNLSGRMGEEAS